MIKIDLVTGFLGSGKTTFIKHYANYLKQQNKKVCILENDFGAINVDMMLLSEIRGDNVELEMISGGGDLTTHIRRFRTKLIQMAITGYDNVIVEPSGIFDIDEFLDLIYEDPLPSYYEIGSIIAIVDENTKLEGEEDKYIFANEIATSGVVVISKIKEHKNLISFLNESMEFIKCPRIFNEKEIIYLDFNDIDYSLVENAGYNSYPFEKRQIIENNKYNSIYLMNLEFNKDEIIEKISSLFKDKSYGNVIRIKGFVFDNDEWYELNYTKFDVEERKIKLGQNVIIIIGSNLNEGKIKILFNK